MPNQTITLRGKSWLVPEPTFGQIKQVLQLSETLNDKTISNPQKQDAFFKLLKILIKDKQLFKKGLSRLFQKAISPQEMADFLTALPVLCGFEQITTAHATSQDPWGELYAFLAANHGYDWEQIDNTLTLSRWKTLNNYWTDYPPTNILKAAELDYKPTRQETFLQTAERMAGLTKK